MLRLCATHVATLCVSFATLRDPFCDFARPILQLCATHVPTLRDSCCGSGWGQELMLRPLRLIMDMLRLCATETRYVAPLCDPNELYCDFARPKQDMLRICATQISYVMTLRDPNWLFCDFVRRKPLVGWWSFGRTKFILATHFGRNMSRRPRPEKFSRTIVFELHSVSAEKSDKHTGFWLRWLKKDTFDPSFIFAVNVYIFTAYLHDLQLLDSKKKKKHKNFCLRKWGYKLCQDSRQLLKDRIWTKTNECQCGFQLSKFPLWLSFNFKLQLDDFLFHFIFTGLKAPYLGWSLQICQNYWNFTDFLKLSSNNVDYLFLPLTALSLLSFGFRHRMISTNASRKSRLNIVYIIGFSIDEMYPIQVVNSITFGPMWFSTHDLQIGVKILIAKNGNQSKTNDTNTISRTICARLSFSFWSRFRFWAALVTIVELAPKCARLADELLDELIPFCLLVDAFWANVVAWVLLLFLLFALLFFVCSVFSGHSSISPPPKSLFVLFEATFLLFLVFKAM